jgi:hypothetical protein
MGSATLPTITDDRILYKSGSINAITVSDPINFIKVFLYDD